MSCPIVRREGEMRSDFPQVPHASAASVSVRGKSAPNFILAGMIDPGHETPAEMLGVLV